MSEIDDKKEMKPCLKKVIMSDPFELFPSPLDFITGAVDSDDFTLDFNTETLQEIKVIRIAKKKLSRDALETLKKFSEKSSKEEDDEDDKTKEVELDE